MASKRKQILGLGFLCLVVLSFAVTVQAVEARRTPDWQRALAGVWPLTQVIETVHAQKPETFTLATGYIVHDAGHFVTLPAAPREVYCVAVRHRATVQLVFVNYYTDNLWRSGWVVMEDGVLPADADTQQQLDTLGCQLTLPS